MTKLSRIHHEKARHLALGTAQFGMPYGIANKTGKPSVDEVAKVIELARSVGMDTIDTALVYGDSENILGEVGVQDFKIVTKLPEVPENLPIDDWIKQQIEASLSHLKIDQLYALLLHKPEQLEFEIGREIINTLVDCKKEGLVKKIGVSVYSPTEMECIFTKFIPDIVQLPFNLVDRRFFDDGWFIKLQKHQVEIHTRSAFLQGLLLMPHQEIRDSFSKWNYVWSKWFNWLEKTKIHPTHGCLEFVLSFPQIHRVVIGVDHSRHLAEILDILIHNPTIREFPSIATDDVELINPSLWKL
ncbi:Aldo/keto reductase [Gloeomargarita lithophora Alchichica-D10]|uniref:Aldo/keto reductase n=1 Tax=Gloeomargarita lithophora Alchichica-D10 TaxID=1188229 RepID=A0A1J0ADE3_9CYAN|nr:aldo/keto reductase [Gloeomargarita lithophora]APB33966.1 Aldo/keto reductase [Gloeomargarita lithophora Alchichica-D10]